MGDLFCRENLMADEQLAGLLYHVGAFGSQHVATRLGDDLGAGRCLIPARFFQPCSRGVSHVTSISGVILGTWDPGSCRCRSHSSREPTALHCGLCACCHPASATAALHICWLPCLCCGTRKTHTGEKKNALRESRGRTSAVVLFPALLAPRWCLKSECSPGTE